MPSFAAIHASMLKNGPFRRSEARRRKGGRYIGWQVCIALCGEFSLGVEGRCKAAAATPRPLWPPGNPIAGSYLEAKCQHSSDNILPPPADDNTFHEDYF